MPSISIWPLEAQEKSTKQTEMDTFSNFSNNFHFTKVYKDKRITSSINFLKDKILSIYRQKVILLLFSIPNFAVSFIIK